MTAALDDANAAPQSGKSKRGAGFRRNDAYSDAQKSRAVGLFSAGPAICI